MARPGARWSASTGGSPSTRRGGGWAPGSPCRATSIRRPAWPALAVAEAETRDVLDAGRDGGRPHLQPRSRGAARDRPGRPRAGGRARPRRGPGGRTAGGGPGRTPPDDRARPTDRGARHGPRHAGLARRHRALLHRDPPRAAARPPSCSPSSAGRYRAIGGTSPLTERTGGPGGRAGRGPRGGGARAATRCAAGPSSPTAHRGRAWRLWPPPGWTGSSASCSPPTPRSGSGEYVRRAERGGGGGRPPGPRSRWSSSGTGPRASLDLLADRTAARPGRRCRRRASRPDGGALHRPQPPRAGGGRGRPLPAPGGRVGRRHRRRGPGRRARADLEGGLAERGPDGRPVARARPAAP